MPPYISVTVLSGMGEGPMIPLDPWTAYYAAYYQYYNSYYAAQLIAQGALPCCGTPCPPDGGKKGGGGGDKKGKGGKKGKNFV